MPHSSHNSRPQGERAEACFLRKAIEQGLAVSKPWGECVPYDFIVDAAGRLLRIQVKSVSKPMRNSYHVAAGAGNRSKRPYTPAQIDFLVVYLIPEDSWYVIPVAALNGCVSFWLRPSPWPRASPRRTRPRPGRFDCFREAWDLLPPSSLPSVDPGL